MQNETERRDPPHHQNEEYQWAVVKFNVSVIWVPERGERGEREDTKKLFEEILVSNFPNFPKSQT